MNRRGTSTTGRVVPIIGAGSREARTHRGEIFSHPVHFSPVKNWRAKRLMKRREGESRSRLDLDRFSHDFINERGALEAAIASFLGSRYQEGDSLKFLSSGNFERFGWMT